MTTNMRNLKLINKIKKSGVAKQGSMASKGIDAMKKAGNAKADAEAKARAKYKKYAKTKKYAKDTTDFMRKLADESIQKTNEAYNEPQGQAKRMMSPLQKMRMDKEKADRDRDGKLKPGVIKKEFHAKGMEPKPTKKKPQSSTAKSLADIRKRANEAKVDEISVDKMMDYKQRAKYSRDKASNSQAAHALRGTDPSKDKDTERKRNRGLKTFDKVAARKVRNSLMKNEDYKSEYQRHVQGRKDAEADMKRAKNNVDMVKAMNKKQHHDKALSKMNRMESSKEEGYVSMAQQRAVWATRKDGGKGHPDNKGKKKK